MNAKRETLERAIEDLKKNFVDACSILLNKLKFLDSNRQINLVVLIDFS